MKKKQENDNIPGVGDPFDLERIGVDSLLDKHGEWDHYQYLIEGFLEFCELDEPIRFKDSVHMTFLTGFEKEIKEKLIKAGFKKINIDDQYSIELLVSCLDYQGIKQIPMACLTWDEYFSKALGESTYPKGSITYNKNQSMFWIKPDIDAALRVLKNIPKVKRLLVDGPNLNKEALELYLRTFELIINVARAGVVLKQLKIGRDRSKAQSDTRGKRKTWRGKDKDELKARDKKIIQRFKKARKTNPLVTPSGFAQKHASEYNLSQRWVHEIIKKAVGS